MLSRRIFVSRQLPQNSLEDIGLTPYRVFFFSRATTKQEKISKETGLTR